MNFLTVSLPLGGFLAENLIIFQLANKLYHFKYQKNVNQ